jgi:multidrug efflux system outer membrane protein
MKHILGSIGLLSAAALLIGCTMIPRYQRPAAPVAATYPTEVESSSHAAATGNGSNLGWREFINDRRLQRLIELALANNRDLRVATLNVEQARAQYRITRSASFPTVDASGTYDVSRSGSVTFPGLPSTLELPGVSPISRQWSLSANVNSYELDLFGHVRSLNKQALEQYFATDEAKRDAQISLISQLATEYFTLRQTEEQLVLARNTLQSVEDSFVLNQATFDAGQTNELDLRTAEGQVQTAKVNISVYERQQAQAMDELVLLVGEPLPSDLPEPLAFGDPGVLAEVPPGLPSDLVRRRPDILEAEHTLVAANANIGAARAAFFPTISLTGSVGSTSTELSGLLGPGNSTWNFAPSITLPIFTGGKNRASLDSAKIATRIDVADYEKAIQTAFREVADALVADRTYAQQIEAEEGAIRAQQRRLQLATLRYRQGEDSYLNVLSAQQDLYSAQQARLEAQFNRLASDISLYQALGGGWK